MVSRISLFLLLVCLGCGVAETPPPAWKPGDKPPVQCRIRGESACAVGAVPQFVVELVNQTESELTLVDRLDGSDCGMRYPICTFEIQRPPGWTSLGPVLRCGNTNPLIASNFVRVSPDGVLEIDSSQRLQREFHMPGEYRLTYRYSTESPTVKDWYGSLSQVSPSSEIMRLFRRVPKFEVRSEEFVVTVTE